MSRRKKKSTPSTDSKSGAVPDLGRRFGRVWLPLVCVGIAILVGWVVKRGQAGRGEKGMMGHGDVEKAVFAVEVEGTVFSRYAGSTACRDCHADAFAKWQGSHHGLAERRMDAQLDGAAFEPAKEIKAGSQVSEARVRDGKFELVTAGLKAAQETFVPERAIGVDPLRQYLVAAPGGRWQATELAFDPHQQEWFDVYGNEDRRPGEWGHWTGRGMTWNQMCVSCHNTRVRKNYEVATDSYHTAMAEMTVGCEACHGPMRVHVDWQRGYAAKHGGSAQSLVLSAQSDDKKAYPTKTGDPTLVKMSRDQMLDTCGMCHARRAELTGDFAPGEKFFDHFALSVPDESELFYPDGQVHEEDYEFTSFLGSKMHAAGVRCMDCHDPHTSKNPVEGNALCMRCHGAAVVAVPGVAVAPQIVDPDHSFHKAGTVGSRCVDCHMPETTYMQRHARRDHGFTIPDPLLTKEQNIPNACNRCHADKPAEWALEACNQRYGDKMNRSTRMRAQWVAQARAGVAGSEKNLVRLLSEEKIPLWRAVAANLLRNAAQEPDVIAALTGATKDPSDLVRSMAARALGGALPGGPEMEFVPGRILDTVKMPVGGPAEQLSALLDDPSRAVRIDAAWALRAHLDTSSRAGGELLHYLTFNRDQPSGLTQWANFLEDRGDSAGALAAFRQAVEWDGGSPPLRSNYAIALSMDGQQEEAAKQLGEAVRIAPRDAQMRYTYALALNEVNRAAEAREQLEQAVRLDPQFGRAWYNLGLARNVMNQPESALEALARAEALDPGNAQAPYAAATIYSHLQRTEEAAQAARRALKIDPNYREAAELLRMLSAPR